jgi:hypothetical protein
MYGEWFGQPYDNFHTLVEVEAAGDELRLRFDEGETLSVWDPREVVLSSDVFRIGGASRVRWEWFSYGRPQTPENLHTIEYAVEGWVDLRLGRRRLVRANA